MLYYLYLGFMGFMMSVGLHQPNFNVGDCISKTYETEFSGTQTITHKIFGVGHHKYWLENEYESDYHFDIYYIDSEYKKVDCK